MSDFQYALVLIVPAEHVQFAEAIGQALGYTGREYTIPLSSDGAAPATHYALDTLIRAPFKAVLEGFDPPGADEQALALLRTLVVKSIRPASAYGGHLASVLVSQELKIVLPPEGA